MPDKTAQYWAPLTFDLTLPQVQKIEAVRRARALRSASEVVRLAIAEFNINTYAARRPRHRQISVRLDPALREKLRREKGEVVERDYAIEQGFSFARRLRDQWLGWPARVSALMAAELGVDPHKLEALLSDQVREQLQVSAADELRLHERMI